MEPVDLFQPIRRHAVDIQRAEDGDHVRIELRPRVRLELVEGLDVRERLLVRTLVDHRVVGIRDGNDPGAKRDLLPAQSVGIPGAVEALVVMQHHRNGVTQARCLLEDQLADAGMFTDRLPFAIRQ